MNILSIQNSTLVRLFVEGGYIGMTIITVLLTLMFLAAWKAPAWVRNIGLTGFLVGILWTLLGCHQFFGAMQKAMIEAPDISPALIWGGFKVTIIPLLYGLIVYIIAIVIDTIRKPRI